MQRCFARAISNTQLRLDRTVSNHFTSPSRNTYQIHSHLCVTCFFWVAIVALFWNKEFESWKFTVTYFWEVMFISVTCSYTHFVIRCVCVCVCVRACVRACVRVSQPLHIPEYFIFPTQPLHLLLVLFYNCKISAVSSPKELYKIIISSPRPNLPTLFPLPDLPELFSSLDPNA